MIDLISDTASRAPAGLILAASSSNSGKTTLSLGIQRLMQRKGLRVAPAKCGPDYIDPAFHQVASDHPSINLDPWAMSKQDIQFRAKAHSIDHDVLFVEGVMGLFDGAANGKGSTAELARHLKLPILLILDVKGQAQTAAAIAHGIRSFDADLNIAGVLLNRVGSPTHEALLREAFEKIDLPVLGAVRPSDQLSLPSRHLGLIQAGEYHQLSDRIDQIADHVSQFVDLDAILTLASSATAHIHSKTNRAPNSKLHPLGQHIAIAKDEAFSFIYPHILSDWREQGAEISFFSPLKNEAPLSQADAIYLPGGYPELHLEALSAADKFRAAMHKAAANNICIFGECGGFMVLGRTIESDQSAEHEMLDLLPLKTSFSNPKLKLGYRKTHHKSNLPFQQTLSAHEFHYAAITWQGDCDPLFSAENASRKKLPSMGQKSGSVFGSFAHIIAPSE